MMNISEKLCLRWNDFQENARSAFGELRGEKDFADVTLACEDGEQVEAHHIEANHITGVNHTCDICGKISRLTN